MFRFLSMLLAAGALWIADPSPTPAQWIGNTKEQVQSQLSTGHQSAHSEELVNLARKMLGRPYSAFSLDTSPGEQLRLYLTSFDCVLLVEQLLALVHSNTTTNFSNLVQQLRYENGTVDYCHRNHYFSKWAANAQKLGLLNDISMSMPQATRRSRRLSFMSSHPDSYAPMKQSQPRACIKEREQNLTVSQAYVPLTALSAAIPHLKSGDIFALVTSVDGLDVTHTGILERTDSGLNAIHAIPESGVVRSLDFLQYASKVEAVVGVSFFRPTP